MCFKYGIFMIAVHNPFRIFLHHLIFWYLLVVFSHSSWGYHGVWEIMLRESGSCLIFFISKQSLCLDVACRSRVGVDVQPAAVCQWSQAGETECQLALPHLSSLSLTDGVEAQHHDLLTLTGEVMGWRAGVPTSPALHGLIQSSGCWVGWRFSPLLEAITPPSRGIRVPPASIEQEMED